MATRQKTTKPTKREMVMPFDGEENFVIPKRGGFGQPDNENYAMLVAPTTISDTPTTQTNQPIQTGQGLGASTIESGNTTSTSSPLQTQIPLPRTTNTDTPSLPPLANLPSTPIVSNESTTTLPTTTTTPPRTSTTTPPRVGTLVDTITTTTTPPCPSGTIVNGVCVETLPPTSTLPTFPSWSTLDCTTLRSEIDRLKNYMMTARFSDTTILDAYNTQIALGETTYSSKCNATPTTPPIAIISTPEPSSGGGGGIGGGGGGGGLGEPPSDEASTEEAPKPSSKKTWLVLLGVIGLLYLLTKKSK